MQFFELEVGYEYLVCGECYNKIEMIYVVSTGERQFCECSEIRDGYYDPKKCRTCDDSGCPAHMTSIIIEDTLQNDNKMLINENDELEKKIQELEKINNDLQDRINHYDNYAKLF